MGSDARTVAEAAAALNRHIDNAATVRVDQAAARGTEQHTARTQTREASQSGQSTQSQ